MPKIIAFIPARGGSKSIPLKNIRLLAGKPLIYWALKAASGTPLIDKIYVATDNKEIEETTLNLNINKVSIFNRTPANAKDDSSTESVLLEFLHNNKLNDDDLLLLIQVTSPFTTSNDLTKAILQFKQSNCNSLLSVVEFKRFIWNKFAVPLNYNYKKRPRRQDFSGYYLENGAFYVSSVKDILKNKNRLSKTIDLYVMPSYTSLELDEPEDWIIAEEFIKKIILPKEI